MQLHLTIIYSRLYALLSELTPPYKSFNQHVSKKFDLFSQRIITLLCQKILGQIFGRETRGNFSNRSSEILCRVVKGKSQLVLNMASGQSQQNLCQPRTRLVGLSGCYLAMDSKLVHRILRLRFDQVEHSLLILPKVSDLLGFSSY